MNRYILLFLIGFLLTTFSCTSKKEIAGTDTETIGGKIQGNLVDEQGNPLEQADVSLIPADYNPHSNTSQTIKTTQTDSEGNFILNEVIQGVYNIEIFSSDSSNAAIIQSITVTDSQETNGSIIEFKDQQLNPTRNVQIALDGYNIEEGGTIYIPGSSVFESVDSNIINSNSISILNVPQNVDVDVYYQVSADSAPQEVVDSLVITSDTVLKPYEQWNYSAEVTSNLSAIGTELKSNLYNYPLLITINKAVFDSLNLESDGIDIRFSKKDFTPVPFEIETWNSHERNAVVWVLIDTLFAPLTSQTLLLHWGNTSAKAGEKPEEVFNPQDGFIGVWHLNESGNSKPSNYQNSSNSKFHGTGYGIDGSSRVEGKISDAQYFDGVDDYIEIPESRSGEFNFKQDGKYTISAWVHPDSLDGNYHPIVHKGDHQYGLKLHRNDLWEFVEYQSDARWHFTQAPAEEKKWTLITGVRDGGQSLLYINGVLADSSSDILSDTTNTVDQRDTTHNVRIGSNSTYGVRLWKGKIDEVRVSNAAKSFEWIKMDYYTQIIDSQFIQFNNIKK